MILCVPRTHGACRPRVSGPSHGPVRLSLRRPESWLMLIWNMRSRVTQSDGRSFSIHNMRTLGAGSLLKLEDTSHLERPAVSATASL